MSLAETVKFIHEVVQALNEDEFTHTVWTKINGEKKTVHVPKPFFATLNKEGKEAQILCTDYFSWSAKKECGIYPDLIELFQINGINLEINYLYPPMTNSLNKSKIKIGQYDSIVM